MQNWRTSNRLWRRGVRDWSLTTENAIWQFDSQHKKPLFSNIKAAPQALESGTYEQLSLDIVQFRGSNSFSNVIWRQVTLFYIYTSKC